LDGCAATVATLLQPNMWAITAALRAGNIAPPGAFLATVDQSQWCAPSADGTPCYAAQILGATGTLATDLLGTSSALDVYGNVKSDLQAYNQAVNTVSTDKTQLATRNQQLVAAQEELSAAQQKLAAAQQALQQFAVDTYVSGGTYAAESFMNLAGPKPFGPLNTNGVVANQYENIVGSELDAADQAAQATEKASLSHRDGASKAVTQATVTLASDNAAETRALARLVDDVSTLQKAGACTTAMITVAAPGTPPAAAPTGTGTSPAGSTPGAATTTTTTTAPTTTTTVPPSTTTSTSTTTTTTTTVPTTVPPSTVPTSSTTTTTAPPSTVPTSSTTTTTTTTPSSGQKSPTATPPAANPAGIQVLQGCISALAPPPGS
jgi:hypothetical protein